MMKEREYFERVLAGCRIPNYLWDLISPYPSSVAQARIQEEAFQKRLGFHPDIVIKDDVVSGGTVRLAAEDDDWDLHWDEACDEDLVVITRKEDIVEEEKWTPKVGELVWWTGDDHITGDVKRNVMYRVSAVGFGVDLENAGKGWHPDCLRPVRVGDRVLIAYDDKELPGTVTQPTPDAEGWVRGKYDDGDDWNINVNDGSFSCIRLRTAFDDVFNGTERKLGFNKALALRIKDAEGSGPLILGPVSGEEARQRQRRESDRVTDERELDITSAAALGEDAQGLEPSAALCYKCGRLSCDGDIFCHDCRPRPQEPPPEPEPEQEKCAECGMPTDSLFFVGGKPICADCNAGDDPDANTTTDQQVKRAVAAMHVGIIRGAVLRHVRRPSAVVGWWPGLPEGV